ncbi:MAG: 16S rRNA (guanine(966)-N(2))-methyltransferase RsmD [Pacificimonas sp.]
MKIIAGDWRGRKLSAPASDVTRPTSARSREALFSMLVSRLGGFERMRVLDGFAGTGALGLEALSRGAAHCTFVEPDRAALAALRSNLDMLGAGDRARVLPRRMAAVGMAAEAVDLVLLDAPYNRGLTLPAIEALGAGGWLKPDALIAAETSRNETLEGTDFDIVAERRYGKARLTLIRILESGATGKIMSS